MKLNSLCVFLALSCVAGFAAERPVETCIRYPNATNGYELVQSPVLKVLTNDNGKVSYRVRYKDSEAVVSDRRASGNYKAGDTISFFAFKISRKETNSTTLDRQVFILVAMHTL